MSERMDGSRRIAWAADGYESIDVYARWRAHDDLESFARDVADIALLNRSVVDLRSALRRQYPGRFDLLEDTRPDHRRVVVALHPPPGIPNPDV
jgi:hypothetical protein